MDKCCWDCCKFLLFIINFAALLVVGAVLGGAVYLLFQSREVLGFNIDPDLSSDNPTAIFFSLILIIIVVFGFLVIFTFLGCCGSACQNQCMLGSFIIILFIFLGANIAGIVYLFSQFPNEVEMAANELEKTIPYYDPSDDKSLSKLFWDSIQPTLGCCGAEGWQDWAAAEKMSNGQKVPKSCCRNPDSCSVHSPSAEDLYMIGCVRKVELPFRITFWAIPSVMAFVLISALVVCSRQKNREGRHYRQRYNRSSGGVDYTEETGYMYRGSATPEYPRAPPYNPEYPAHQNPYADQYPTGVIPPNSADYTQPLIKPPAYHDVVPSGGRR